VSEEALVASLCLFVVAVKAIVACGPAARRQPVYGALVRPGTAGTVPCVDGITLPAMMKETVIYFSPELRVHWPSRLHRSGNPSIRRCSTATTCVSRASSDEMPQENV
jgi:hypothetical protein